MVSLALCTFAVQLPLCAHIGLLSWRLAVSPCRPWHGKESFFYAVSRCPRYCSLYALLTGQMLCAHILASLVTLGFRVWLFFAYMIRANIWPGALLYSYRRFMRDTILKGDRVSYVSQTRIAGALRPGCSV